MHARMMSLSMIDPIRTVDVCRHDGSDAARARRTTGTVAVS